MTSTPAEGRELDWFGRDCEGRLALFATGGSGPVPRIAIRSLEAHERVADMIPVHGWGSADVWLSFSAVGVYAYDWDQSDGLYRQVATPACQTVTSLEAALESVEIPIFGGRFSSTLELGPSDLQIDA